MSRLFRRLTWVVSIAIVGAGLSANGAGATGSPSYPDYPQCLFRALGPTHTKGDSKAQPRARVDGCGRYGDLVNPDPGATQGTYRVKYEIRLLGLDGEHRSCVRIHDGKCIAQGVVDVRPVAGKDNDFVFHGVPADCNEDAHGNDEVASQARVTVFNFSTHSYVAWSGWDTSAVVTMAC